MSDVPENELLSAYLDGELTADEQAHVEKLLADNPQARQLLDELRALSATLQSLPQYKLGEDISQQVLRVAERRMLTGTSDLPQPAKQPAEPRESRLRHMLSRRALVWSGLAVGIAVVLMVNDANRPPPHGGKVALAPDAPGEHEASAPDLADGAVASRERKPEGEKRLAEGRKRSESAVAAGQRDSYKLAREGKAAETEENLGKSAVAGDGLHRVLKPGAAPQRAEERLKESDEKKLAAKSQAAQTPGAAAIAGKGPAFSFGAAGGPASGAGNVDAFRSETGGAGAAPAGRTSGKGGGEVADHAKGVLVGKDGGGRGMGGMAGAPYAQKEGAPDADNGVLLVYCDVSPEAAQKQAFAKLLTDNKIVWAEPADGQSVLADAPTRQLPATVQKHGDADTGQPAKVREVLARDREKADAGGLELVYVEAPAERIEAALAQLKARPDSFLSVSVQAAPHDESHQGWSRYNRRSGEKYKAGADPQKAPAEKPGGSRGSPAADDSARREQAEENRDKDLAKQENVSLGRAQRIPLPAIRLDTGGLQANLKLQDNANDELQPARQPARPSAKERSLVEGGQPAAEPARSESPPPESVAGGLRTSGAGTLMKYGPAEVESLDAPRPAGGWGKGVVRVLRAKRAVMPPGPAARPAEPANQPATCPADAKLPEELETCRSPAEATPAPAPPKKPASKVAAGEAPGGERAPELRGGKTIGGMQPTAELPKTEKPADLKKKETTTAESQARGKQLETGERGQVKQDAEAGKSGRQGGGAEQRQPPPPQRVLFVLRVVPAGVDTSKAAIMLERSAREAEAAPAAKSK